MRFAAIPAGVWLLAVLLLVGTYLGARYQPVRRERAAVRALLCELGASTLPATAARRWVDQVAPARGLPWLRGADLYLQRDEDGVDAGLRWQTAVPHLLGLRHELASSAFARVAGGRCTPFELAEG